MASSVPVELRLAGAFGVFRGGVELSEEQVGSRKARMLLKLLAVERPGLVPVDRIVDVLWVDEPPAAVRQNVATLVSRLRGAVGRSAIIGGPHDGYRLAGEPHVSVDLDVAARLCGQAEHKLATAPGVALAAAERSIALLAAGTALADEPYAAWADAARHELREQLRRARLVAAEAALAAGQAESAARHAWAAIAADPLDEAAHRWYMSAAAAAGEPAKALAAYAALSQRLRDELGADPAVPTQQLHLAILREQPAAPPAASASPALSKPQARPATPLAGRDAELGGLQTVWTAAVSGTPSLVMIVGEAGIGKTTLAEALATEAAADGATVLRTRCYEAERSLFLQPIVDAIAPVVLKMPTGAARVLLGEHAPAIAALVPEATALLGAPTGWRGSAEMERRRAFEAVTALLTGLAADHPVVLLVDDLQYAGQSSAEFIHYLSRHSANCRLLTLVTMRAENEAELNVALAGVATRIELGPLSLAAVEQLARQAGQAGLTQDIMERTRGHTLFVVEVLRALAAGVPGVPESLRNAVLARVRSTGPASEALLRAAAVLGAALDPLVLSTLLDLTAATAIELCTVALEARLLVVSGRDYEFANDLVREVLYTSTPEPARLAYHRRAADLLTGQPEAMARHAAAAGDWRRAGRAWLLAAENAMLRYAASDAIALATQALSATEQAVDIEVAARALLLRGRALHATGAHDAAFADLKSASTAARSVGDHRLEMLVLLELGYEVAISHGVPIAECAANLETGLRIAESLADRATEAQLRSRLAIIETNRLQLDVALDDGIRAVAAGRASGDEQALVAGLDGLKIARLSVGDVRGLAAVIAELNPALRRVGDLFRLQWTQFEEAFLAVSTADWERAARGMRSALETNRRGGYPQFAAWYTAHLGWLARMRGRDAEAVELGRRAFEMTGQYRHSVWRAAAGTMLGATVLASGDRAEAIALFERGMDAAREAGVEAYLLRCLAPLAAATGSKTMLAEAAGLLERAGIPADGAWLLGYEAYLSIASAWLDHGEPDRARAALQPLLAVAEREPWTPVLAASLVIDARTLIGLGNPAQARCQLERAARLAADHGMPHVLSDALATRQAL